MVQVVAAVLEQDGRVLICRRRADQKHPLKWEFPGGKVEAGEAAERAVTRELQEELDIEVTSTELIERYEFSYPGKPPIELHFFRVTGWRGVPRNLIFHELRWEERGRLREHDFLEGDLSFLERYSRADLY